MNPEALIQAHNIPPNQDQGGQEPGINPRLDTVPQSQNMLFQTFPDSQSQTLMQFQTLSEGQIPRYRPVNVLAEGDTPIEFQTLGASQIRNYNPGQHEHFEDLDKDVSDHHVQEDQDDQEGDTPIEFQTLAASQIRNYNPGQHEPFEDLDKDVSDHHVQEDQDDQEGDIEMQVDVVDHDQDPVEPDADDQDAVEPDAMQIDVNYVPIQPESPIREQPERHNQPQPQPQPAFNPLNAAVMARQGRLGPQPRRVGGPRRVSFENSPPGPAGTVCRICQIPDIPLDQLRKCGFSVQCIHYFCKFHHDLMRKCSGDSGHNDDAGLAKICKTCSIFSLLF